MNILAIVTEFTYFDQIETLFGHKGDEHKITEFLGMCNTCISLFNMGFGIFLYSRVTKKMGVHNIILIAPLFFMSTFLLWLTGDYMYIIFLAFFAREGMTFTFEDNNLNLLISGAPPRIKNQTRAAIEMFMEPAGMLVSGLLLIGLMNQSKFLGLTISGVALSAMLLLRIEYPKAIFYNLLAYTVRFEKKATDWLKSLSRKEAKDVEFYLLLTMKRGDERAKLLAYESLLKLGNRRNLARLLHQIKHFSIPGKLKALDLLFESQFSKDALVTKLLKRWSRASSHPTILGAIHFYSARLGQVSPYQIANSLSSQNLVLKGAAILSFKTSCETREKCDLHTLARNNLQSLLDSKDEQEISMGLCIWAHEANPLNIPRLMSYLNHSSQNVRQMAARAIANSASSQMQELVSTLINSLSSLLDAKGRFYLLQAIEKMGPEEYVKELICSTIHFRPAEKREVERIVLKIGMKTKKLLIDLLKDTKIRYRPRLLAGKILGHLSHIDLQNNLETIIHNEIETLHCYFYHAHTIGQMSPQYDLRILESALFSGFHKRLDFIIQLAGISARIEESEVIAHSLRSKNQKIRAAAQETIEKALDAKLFAKIEPLIDDRSLSLKLNFYLRLRKSPLSLIELLDKLEASPSITDQLVSLSLKSRFAMPRWQEVLKEKIETGEEIFHHFNAELSPL